MKIKTHQKIEALLKKQAQQKRLQLLEKQAENATLQENKKALSQSVEAEWRLVRQSRELRSLFEDFLKEIQTRQDALQENIKANQQAIEKTHADIQALFRQAQPHKTVQEKETVRLKEAAKKLEEKQLDDVRTQKTTKVFSHKTEK